MFVVNIATMKCVDSVYRNALWLKMFAWGIQGKLLRIVRDAGYCKSCGEACGSYSEYFTLIAVGLR